MWYQSFNSFGEIVFVQRWKESEAHPTLASHTFHSQIDLPKDPDFEIRRWCSDDPHKGHWVIY